MGEMLQDSKCYILQWWDKYYDECQDIKYPSLKVAKQGMASLKILDKKDGVKTKYRIIKETTKQEVVYDECRQRELIISSKIKIPRVFRILALDLFAL